MAYEKNSYSNVKRIKKADAKIKQEWFQVSSINSKLGSKNGSKSD